jgi:hypothetical protein
MVSVVLLMLSVGLRAKIGQVVDERVASRRTNRLLLLAHAPISEVEYPTSILCCEAPLRPDEDACNATGQRAW